MAQDEAGDTHKGRRMKDFGIFRSIFSQIVFVWLAFILMAVITFFFVGNIVRGYLAKEAGNTLSYMESRIATDLLEAETVLQTVSQSILVMILRGSSADVIKEHMLEVTGYLSSSEARVSGLNGIYGFFYCFGDMFIDGSGWEPPEDYAARERPWYTAALDAGGGIAATTPYLSLFPGEPVVSYSRLIYDTAGKPLGVISLDISLDKMAEYVVHTRLTEGGYGILVSNALELIAAPSKKDLGRHISALPYTGIPVAVNQLEKGADIFEHIITDASLESDFVLSTRRIKNGWHIGILTPIDKYYQQVTDMRLFIAAFGAAFAFALSLVLLRIARAKQKADEESLEAKTASKAKDDFLATMSHEMRTPLNAIIGLSEIEMQNHDAYGLPEASRDNIRQIHRSGTTLLEIVNDILDISKIEAGRFELYPHTYAAASMIHGAILLSRVRIGKMPVQFNLEISGGFPEKLFGDELRVQQILNNLLSNAIKYTRQGTVTLGVTHETRQAGKAVVRFRVEDTGIGIRAEDMCKLFSKYIQLDTGASRKTEGTGLGLPIVKNLAEIMGGGVTVQSEFGRGSCFTAEILQGIEGDRTIGDVTAGNLQNGTFTDEIEKEKIEYLWLPDARVLVVDDLPANQKVMKGLLAPYGIQVDTALSGEEAIGRIQEHAYDIVFMDHMMPEMDGVDAAARIRAWEKENTRDPVTIIAMTANAIRGVREYYLENGFDEYISKPVIVKNLHTLLVTWITAPPRPYPDGIQPPAPPIPQSLTPLFVEQCVDVLRHYQKTFESGRAPDADYYARFTGYIQTLDGEYTHSLRAQFDELLEAGRKRDRESIRALLPDFCEALQSRCARDQAINFETEKNAFGVLLPRLEDALRSGNIQEANAILRGIGSSGLTDAGREFYIRLYDLLFEEKIEEALVLIKERV